MRTALLFSSLVRSDFRKLRSINSPPVYLAHSLRFIEIMRHRSGPRIWIWAALSVQLLGLAFDAVWYGLLNLDFEAVIVDQMVRHLSTVHLPLYIGVLSVLVSTDRVGAHRWNETIKDRRRPASRLCGCTCLNGWGSLARLYSPPVEYSQWRDSRDHVVFRFHSRRHRALARRA